MLCKPTEALLYRGLSRTRIYLITVWGPVARISSVKSDLGIELCCGLALPLPDHEYHVVIWGRVCFIKVAVAQVMILGTRGLLLSICAGPHHSVIGYRLSASLQEADSCL